MHRKLTLKAVEAQIRKLEAQAKKLKEAEKPGMAELKAVIAKFKLAPADIKAAMKAPRSKGARRSMAKGNKLKAKYRNPAKRSETWAGRGLKPKWLSSLIAKEARSSKTSLSSGTQLYLPAGWARQLESRLDPV